MNIPDNYDMWLAYEADKDRMRQEEIRDYGIGHCAHCDDAVLYYEEHYTIHGDLVHGLCLMEYLRKFHREDKFRDDEDIIVGKCAQCGEDIIAGEEFYDIHGDLVHGEDCLLEYAEQFR